MHSADMPRRGICLSLPVCGSTRHVRVLCRNEYTYTQTFSTSGSRSYCGTLIGTRMRSIEYACGTIFNDLKQPVTRFQGHAIIRHYLGNGTNI